MRAIEYRKLSNFRSKSLIKKSLGKNDENLDEWRKPNLKIFPKVEANLRILSEALTCKENKQFGYNPEKLNDFYDMSYLNHFDTQKSIKIFWPRQKVAKSNKNVIKKTINTQEGSLIRSLTQNKEVNLQKYIQEINDEEPKETKIKSKSKRTSQSTAKLLENDLKVKKEQNFKIRRRVISNHNIENSIELPSPLKRKIDYRKFLSIFNPTEVQEEGNQQGHLIVELKGVLGIGSNAQVRLGQVNYQKFAVKIYDKQKFAKNKKNRVYSEIKILSKLPKHNNIIEMVYAFENVKQIHILFQFIQRGRTLQQYFVKKDYSLSESQLKQMYFKIVKGVAHLHAHGISHRDLKPTNIMIGFDEDDKMLVKIIDFGSSSEKKKNSFRCGTPNYMAPQLSNLSHQHDSSCADVWALGVILFYLAQQGRYPFIGNTQMQLQNSIKRGEFSFNIIQNEHIKDIIRKSLEVDPNKRIKSNELLKSKWFLTL